MKLWNEATREDISTEVIPGVETLDEMAVARLNWTSYLSHIGEWVKEGLNHYENAVKEHFDNLTLFVYGERVRAECGEYPTKEEMQTYRKEPSTKALVQMLTKVTAQLSEETWPTFRKMTCERYGIDEKEFCEMFEQ